MMTLPKFQRTELLLLTVIVFVGSFLRLYHLPETFTFRGDQGRDAIIAKHILKDGDIALIGPVTSVGNMYLGPFYYYFMVPFLALTYPNPIGPAIGVAAVNCLSIVMLYLVARQLFNRKVAIVATALYALMPNAIIFSRFSWNPNLAAPVAIGLFWSLVRWYQTRQWKFAMLLSFLLGFIVQLHYVALTTWILAGGVWITAVVRDPKRRRLTLVQGITIAGIAALTLSPLAVFDLRHNHLISDRFIEFFTSNRDYMNPLSRILFTLKALEGRMYQMLSQLVSAHKNVPLDRAVGYGSLAATVFFIIYQIKLKKPISFPHILVFAWLGIAVAGLAFYSSSIFDHYLTYCLPLVALYWGILIVWLWDFSSISKVGSIAIGVSIFALMHPGLRAIPFTGQGTTVARQVVSQALPQVDPPYNLALLADNGDFQGMNYRYFFEVSDKKPQNNEDYLHLKNLIIIDEIHDDNPLSVPAYEVMAPGLSILKTSFTLPNGPRVYIYQ